MTRGLKSFAHSVVCIQLHVVFTTKYRHPVISGDIERDVIDLCKGVASKNKCEILEAKADLGTKDHIHLLIEMAPDVSISRLANTMKTVTSREIRKRYTEELKPYYWKPALWKRGYCATSTGGVGIDVIKKYIQSQGFDD